MLRSNPSTSIHLPGKHEGSERATIQPEKTQGPSEKDGLDSKTLALQPTIQIPSAGRTQPADPGQTPESDQASDPSQATSSGPTTSAVPVANPKATVDTGQNVDPSKNIKPSGFENPPYVSEDSSQLTINARQSAASLPTKENVKALVSTVEPSAPTVSNRTLPKDKKARVTSPVDVPVQGDAKNQSLAAGVCAVPAPTQPEVCASSATQSSEPASSSIAKSPSRALEDSQTPTATMPSGDLAVALKIRSASSDQVDGSHQPDPEASLTTSTQSNGHPGESEGASAKDQRKEHDQVDSIGQEPISLSTASKADPFSQSVQDSGSESGAKPMLNAATEQAVAEPVRGAHVQITGHDNQRIDIRLQERGGELSVTVRSGDANLTRALQDHAPELNSKLSSEHYRSETWTATPKSAFGTNTDGNSSQGQSRGSAYQQQFNQNQNGKQKRQPAWVEEFESHPTAFQKRIDYTWQ
jgi:hypothetical protein